MKTFKLLIIACLLMANAGCRNVKAYDFKRIEAFRDEVAADLIDNLLPWWSSKTPDYVNGGFYGRIDMNDSIYAEADKAGVLNSRIMYTFSAAYRVTGDTSYLRIAARAKDYCIGYFIDKEFGGAYHMLDYRGFPKNTTKHIYTNAYFIYGFAEYVRATGDEEVLEAAKALFELFEKHAFDREYNGYFEDFNREWERVSLSITGASNVDEKTQNTMMQIMLAYTNLYRVWQEEKIAERLRNLVELFLDKIINPNTYNLHYIMDRYLNNISETVSYGHDIELAWFLRDAALLLDDPQLLKRVEDTSVKMAEAVEKAIQPDGSVLNIIRTGNENRSWWPQTEAIVGYFDAWEISGEEKFLDYAINCWNYTRDHFIDRTNGGWFSRANADGEASGDKVTPSVCPYHNGRMSMEIMERVEKLTNKSKKRE